MTRLMVKMMDLGVIVPYEKNAKKHPAGQVDNIARSISEYGFNVPILVDGANMIIAGHGRYLAARKLNLKSVPVIVLDGLSDEQIRKFRLADNKVAESKWDEELLITDLQELKATGYSVLDIPGFAESDIDKLLKGAQDGSGLNDPENVPGTRKNHDIEYGRLYALGNHRLLCGDATSMADVTRLHGGGHSNMCFTDPPYNVNYQGGTALKRKKIKNDNLAADQFYQFMSQVYQNISSALVPGGAFYICHADAGWQAFRDPLAANNLLFKQCLMWIKNQLVLSRSHYHYRHEPILYGHKKGKRFWNGGRHNDSLLFRQVPSITIEPHSESKTIYINTEDSSIIISVLDYELLYQDAGMETVWHFSKPVTSKEHPTMKPVDLVKRAVRNSSAADHIVFDPFLGSGTTLIAAEVLGRICYGIELSPDYCDVVIRRWEEYTGGQAELVEEIKGE